MLLFGQCHVCNLDWTCIYVNFVIAVLSKLFPLSWLLINPAECLDYAFCAFSLLMSAVNSFFVILSWQ